MADKINYEGFSVSTNDVCTADGGFVGGLTGVVGGGVSTVNTGDVDPTDSLVLLSGAISAHGLADGVAGQSITLKATNATPVGVVVTPTNLTDGTTITFDAQYEVAILQFDGTNWQVVYTDATVA